MTHDGSFYDMIWRLLMNRSERLIIVLGIIEKTTSALVIAATELERLEPSNKHLKDIKETIKTNLYFQDRIKDLL